MVQETSTREQAIAWWNTLTLEDQVKLCNNSNIYTIVGKTTIELLYKQENPLTDKQIENWRQFIMIQLDSLSPGTGIYASIMPKEEIIAFYKRTKRVLETSPEVVQAKNKKLFINLNLNVNIQQILLKVLMVSIV